MAQRKFAASCQALAPSLSRAAGLNARVHWTVMQTYQGAFSCPSLDHGTSSQLSVAVALPTRGSQGIPS